MSSTFFKIAHAITLCSVLVTSNMIFADSGGTSLTDGEIIGIYNQVNSFDIEAALLAQTLSHSEKVRKLARSVVEDHSSVRVAAANIGSNIAVNVTVPAAQQKAAHDFYKQSVALRELKGKVFDREYLTQEIQFHRSAIDAIKTVLLPNVKSQELRIHFETVLPHFEHHLAMTIETAKELGYY